MMKYKNKKESTKESETQVTQLVTLTTDPVVGRSSRSLSGHRPATMLQFPGFMKQYPWSTRTIPTSFLLPSQWPQPHSEELLLAMEEADYDEKVLSQIPISPLSSFPYPNLIPSIRNFT